MKLVKVLKLGISSQLKVSQILYRRENLIIKLIVFISYIHLDDKVQHIRAEFNNTTSSIYEATNRVFMSHNL